MEGCPPNAAEELAAPNANGRDDDDAAAEAAALGVWKLLRKGFEAVDGVAPNIGAALVVVDATSGLAR